jgi:CRP-like cAMP-binding protein
MRPNSAAAVVLSAHPVFGALAPELIERLAVKFKLLQAKRGATIFMKGDPAAALFVVLSGTVKIVVLSAGGREVVINLAHAGDSFGEIGPLGDLPRTADAIAMSDCRLLSIDRQALVALAESDVRLALALTRLACLRYQWVSAKLEEALLLDFSRRLAKTLLWLTEKRIAGTSGAVIRLTQAEIARLLGGSRESTNKQLRSWQRSNWVRLHKVGIEVLAPRALAAIADSEAAARQPDLVLGA